MLLILLALLQLPMLLLLCLVPWLMLQLLPMLLLWLAPWLVLQLLLLPLQPGLVVVLHSGQDGDIQRWREKGGGGGGSEVCQGGREGCRSRR